VAQAKRREDNHCGNCSSGYHVVNRRCLPNVCTCAHGVEVFAAGPAESSRCLVHGVEDCASCDTGYILDAPAAAGQQKCVPAKCTCKNGVPALFDSRDSNLRCKKDEEHCVSCASGFRLESSSKRCIDMRSSCVGEGTLAGEGSCACAAGYHGDIAWKNGAWDSTELVSKTSNVSSFDATLNKTVTREVTTTEKVSRCKKNVCSCNNGVATISNSTSPETLCEQHGNEDCSRCDPGFYVSDRLGQVAAGFTAPGPGVQTCKGFAGICDNGYLIDQALRIAENHCGRCNAGYHLENKQCWSNKGSTNLETEVSKLQSAQAQAPTFAAESNAATIVVGVILAALITTVLVLVIGNKAAIAKLSAGNLPSSGGNDVLRSKTLPQETGDVELTPISEKPPVTENPLMVEMAERNQSDPSKKDDDGLASV